VNLSMMEDAANNLESLVRKFITIYNLFSNHFCVHGITSYKGASAAQRQYATIIPTFLEFVFGSGKRRTDVKLKCVYHYHYYCYYLLCCLICDFCDCINETCIYLIFALRK
jgi:hypothetical protein